MKERANNNGSEFSFKVSPRVLAPLGLEQLQDPALAVLELVKNSWDADASRVSIDVSQRGSNPGITVKDNGVGMTRADFTDRWLVIGASHKRGKRGSALERPLIGEKGLGRLASYALGSSLTIKSSASSGTGFSAQVDWDAFFKSLTVEDYRVRLKNLAATRGTTVVIGELRTTWTDKHTEFLSTYTQFLTSVPGQKFEVSLKVNGVKHHLADPLEAIAQIAEADLEMKIAADGTPVICRCSVDGEDFSWVQFRDFHSRLKDVRLHGSKLLVRFYRRDKAARKLSDVLNSNEVNEVLERYQGIRIYRNGINVPPYGLNGDDWAALEKQRTSTGGPTMVPGNSQLTGELRVPASATHLVVTAGRSGFSDLHAVGGLAEYVRWAVRSMGTARRARELGIQQGQGSVPARVDAASKRTSVMSDQGARKALAEVAQEESVRRHPDLRAKFERAKGAVEAVLDKNEETLRLYAQLASTGIAATSFAHELRADFDVVSEAVSEIATIEDVPDEELVSLLTESWTRISNFVALFRLLPVKVRRRRSSMGKSDLLSSLDAVSKLAPGDRIKVKARVADIRISMVPAEFDSLLLNLISNSIKAISESARSEDGKILVNLRARREDLEIRVADNGCGIPQKVLGVMFEPLEGKFAEGTGMGLAIVRFIAERYKGSVSVIDAPVGYSTQITVTLKGVVA